MNTAQVVTEDVLCVIEDALLSKVVNSRRNSEQIQLSLNFCHCLETGGGGDFFGCV